MAPTFVIGGIVSGINSFLGFTAAVTVAAASVARYSIVLTDASRPRVERVTAYGFHVGLLAALVLFIIDQALG
jgi:hypothetical protein